MSPSAAGAGGDSARPTIGTVLQQAVVELSEKLEAEGCALSRLIGELLIDVAWHSQTGKTLFHGRSYLLSDYPVTQEVVEQREPRMVGVADPAADPDEVALLRELDFDTLLMLALESGDECWGLVEIYRAGARTFSDEEIALAQQLVADLGKKLQGVQSQSEDGDRP